MSVPARQVAAAIRERLPGIGSVKLHKLLYYCQGHHLATFDTPLFPEVISAWDMGPVVGTLWREEKGGVPPEDDGQGLGDLGEAELNTIGYVISRYGALNGKELEDRTHSEVPWRTADAHRPTGGRVTIKLDWIRDYFRSDEAQDVADDDARPDAEVVARWLAGIASQPPAVDSTRPDSREALLARRNEILARMAGA